jgi:hydrogenase maturation protein HypF
MSLQAASRAHRRARVRVSGTVQGVGFRPYIYRLASELSLAGYVLNDSRGVLLEVEGGGEAVSELLARLKDEAPPLSAVEQIVVEERELTGSSRFEIRASAAGGALDAPVTADSGTCAECLAELFDPRDRRFRYPFINCTNCGPRFTIVAGIPYDRPLTTMASFEMCCLCRAEYEDPTDRRFHAQPNACPQCGPAVSLLRPDGMPADQRGSDPVGLAAAALLDGQIVAVKGLGGYHVACRADDEDAVARLRARKHREDKPFALMVGSPQDAASLVSLGPLEHELISSTARPIVLAPRTGEMSVAGSVAPHSPELGVMLAYSPLHHLLLEDLRRLLGDQPPVLVMTSGNVSDEPIAYRDEDALSRLAVIADLFLVHDRPIETRTDDSVLRAVKLPDGRRTAMLRRSRGYVPASIPLPGGTAPPVLACGAELKNTFCLAKGGRAWVSHHIGDLENYETLRSFTEGVEHFKRLFEVTPLAVAHDLHPEYLSTKYARELDRIELIGVQHHHAHLAACLAEHSEQGPAIGAIFDGTGYGSDGTVWGGEILYGDMASFRRVGSLLPVRLAGGQQAVLQPWRMACAWLSRAFAADPVRPASLEGSVEEQAWKSVLELVRTGVASPVTSSIGRLFDAVAAICGLRATVSYEGQAAIELEAAAQGDHGRYPFAVRDGQRGLVLDPRETIRALSAELAEGVAIHKVASRFHAAVAAATAEACLRTSETIGTELVVLSGGVFQNRRLIEETSQLLAAGGLRVLAPQLLPANDGGIAYGQAAVAAARLRHGVHSSSTAQLSGNG